MTAPRTRLRYAAAPLLVGLFALLGACAPPPAGSPGITFKPPTIGYIGQQYVPKATASNKLPVSFSLDASSAGCSLIDGVLYFTALGDCVVLADQPGDETNPPLPQVKRTISVRNCPTLREGVWTGPEGTTATVFVGGTIFWGTADLTPLGFGIQSIAGTIECDLVRMTFNDVALSGRLSPDGSRLSASYSGISVVLNAPPA